MYCVLRFIDVCESNDLEKLGKELNQCIPDLYTGLDHIPHRFSCSVYPGDTWELQRRAIIDVLSKCARVIEATHTLGIDVELDLAIEPEDYGVSMLTELQFDKELIGVLSLRRIPIAISIYGMASSEKQ